MIKLWRLLCLAFSLLAFETQVKSESEPQPVSKPELDPNWHPSCLSFTTQLRKKCVDVVEFRDKKDVCKEARNH